MKKYLSYIARLFGRGKKSQIGKTEHEVIFAGKTHRICSQGNPSVSAQQFVDKHAVACGRCGDMMLPGSKIWLYRPEKAEEFDKPAVLAVVGEGQERALVACLGWDCCPTAAFMCGQLDENRTIIPFESIMQKALRTKEPVVVSDVSTYRG